MESPSIKRIIPKRPVPGVSAEFSGILQKLTGVTLFYQIMHFIGHVDQPEVHVESSPERCRVLGLDLQDEGRPVFDPAAGGGTGIYFVRQFRLESPVDLLCVIRREMENRFVACQGKTLSYYGRKDIIKVFFRPWA